MENAARRKASKNTVKSRTKDQAGGRKVVKKAQVFKTGTCYLLRSKTSNLFY